MEVEAGCLLAAIERVAKERGIQSFPVGTMYTELVGTSRLGIESEAEMLVVSLVYYLFGFLEIWQVAAVVSHKARYARLL